jgi:predicted phosphodiesterase
MRINYFSDIHLEFGSSILPENNADIVIAAGDIGPNLQGLEWLQKINKPVIYVAGNHEFYGHDHLEVLHRLHTFSQNSRVNFLENATLVFQNIRFIGCTLWADLYAEGSENAAVLDQSLNDFKQIALGTRKFNPEIYSAFYTHSKQWLEDELAKKFRGKTVVISHHAPTQWSWNRAPNAIKKLAYCNDLKFLMHEYPIDAWFHGHIHNPADYRIAGTRVLSNPRGYFGRKMVSNFDLNRIVDI